MIEAGDTFRFSRPKIDFDPGRQSATLHLSVYPTLDDTHNLAGKSLIVTLTDQNWAVEHRLRLRSGS